ncbi:MAG: helix-turn-helix transcriptional regulator, partial [Reinekea sp.]|nr:helix-turn-helix transcriptional regulator [Reinekea sp.]
MSQTAQLVDTLKKLLRERKITYADVAAHLDLSEANVKRMFSKRHFTLSRLEEVCALANADLSYLMTRMHEGSMIIEELTLEAEKELVGNIKLLMMAQLLINRWEMDDIVNTYTFEEHEVTRLLAKLDRLGIIELLPGNRVRNLVSRDFKWIHNGPVYKFFEKHVATEFFNCKFNPKAGE